MLWLFQAILHGHSHVSVGVTFREKVQRGASEQCLRWDFGNDASCQTREWTAYPWLVARDCTAYPTSDQKALLKPGILTLAQHTPGVLHGPVVFGAIDTIPHLR